MCGWVRREQRRAVRVWDILHGRQRACGDVHERWLLVPRGVLLAVRGSVLSGVLRHERGRRDLFFGDLWRRVHVCGGLLLWRVEHGCERQRVPCRQLLRRWHGAAVDVHVCGWSVLPDKFINVNRRALSAGLLLRQHVRGGGAVWSGVLLPWWLRKPDAVRCGVLRRVAGAHVRHEHLLRCVHDDGRILLRAGVVDSDRDHVPSRLLVQQHVDKDGVQHRGDVLWCGDVDCGRVALRGGALWDLCWCRAIHEQQLRWRVHVRAWAHVCRGQQLRGWHPLLGWLLLQRRHGGRSCMRRRCVQYLACLWEGVCIMRSLSHPPSVHIMFVLTRTRRGLLVPCRHPVADFKQLRSGKLRHVRGHVLIHE